MLGNRHGRWKLLVGNELTYLRISLVVGVACVANADDYAAKRAEVIALGELTSPPAMIDADGFDRGEHR